MAEKFIIELDKQQIEFIAAMTHFYLSYREDDQVANSTLDELCVQTNFVSHNALKHGISSSPLSPLNKTTATRWGINISEVAGNLTDLSGIMDFGWFRGD